MTSGLRENHCCLQWGKKHWGKLPYHFQHHYFFFSKLLPSVGLNRKSMETMCCYYKSPFFAVFPPLLLPVYFHTEVVYYVLRKRMWKVATIKFIFERFKTC